MRMSSAMKGLFVNTTENKIALAEYFNKLYDSKLKELKDGGHDKEASALEKVFGHLREDVVINSAGEKQFTTKKFIDSTSGLHLKMQFAHVQRLNPGGMDKIIKELSKSNPKDIELSKIHAYIFNRTFLTDGGTTNAVPHEWTLYADYLARNGLGNFTADQSAALKD